MCNFAEAIVFGKSTKRFGTYGAFDDAFCLNVCGAWPMQAIDVGMGGFFPLANKLSLPVMLDGARLGVPIDFKISTWV